MNWLEIGLTLLSTGLGIANGLIARKKGQSDKILDVVIEGVDAANDRLTKKAIQDVATQNGVENDLRKRVKRRR